MKHLFKLMAEMLEGDVYCVFYFSDDTELQQFLTDEAEWVKEWKGYWVENA